MHRPTVLRASLQASLQALTAAVCLASTAGSQCERTVLQPLDVRPGDAHGYSVDLSGHTLVAGSVGADPAGAAYVYERGVVTGAWGETAKLVSAGPVGGFGRATAIDGDTIVVGATSSSFTSGSASFFERTSGTWTEVAFRMASDSSADAAFGASVAIEGARAAVGAPGVGAVYVFERLVGDWTEVARLTGLDTAPGDVFGGSVALSDGRILVGASRDDTVAGSSSGSAYVFERSGGAWVQVQKLLASDASAADQFGRSVDLDRDRAVVGAPFASRGACCFGAIYVFDLVGGSWVETAEIQDAGPLSTFRGVSVAIEGDLLVLTDILANSQAGTAYAYAFAAGTWTRVATLLPLATGTYSAFGISCAISEGRLAVGASLWYGSPTYYGGPRTGQAYVFEDCLGVDVGTPYCLANPNSSGATGALSGFGRAGISATALTLRGGGLPVGRLGYFLLARDQLFLPLPGASQANLCLAPPIVRLSEDVVRVDAAGEVRFRPDLAQLPNAAVIQPGDTWSFQLWFRDQNPAHTSNMTNALAVTFETSGDPAAQFPVMLGQVEEAVTQIEVLVTLSQAAGHDVTIPYVDSGTATRHADYRIESLNPLVIPAGERSAWIFVTIADDADVEADETVVIDLSPPTGAALGTSVRHQLTIVDDD